MIITEEMIAEDEKRWHDRNIVAELGYCGKNICHRKSITNDDIRFYAYIMRKAHALLKEQEAKILDLDELENWDNSVWFEDKDEQNCYIALAANVGTFDATFVNVEPGKFHRIDFLREFYKKEWRCWSAKPTAKQRQEVKWE